MCCVAQNLDTTTENVSLRLSTLSTRSTLSATDKPTSERLQLGEEDSVTTTFHFSRQVTHSNFRKRSEMASPNSYPKTQLSSAVTFVRNSDVIRRELEIVSLQEYYWTDSEVVLGYVNKIAD